MSKIETVNSGYYRVPLATVLTDSMHGEMKDFELVTVRIRDADGAEGWVFHSLLSGKRTAVVAPWSKAASLDLYAKADKASGVVARLEPKVLARAEKCDGSWCRIAGQGFSGWLPQENLWGVYPKEKLE